MIVVCVAFRSCKSVILNDFTKSHLIDSVPVLARLEETVGKITLTLHTNIFGFGLWFERCQCCWRHCHLQIFKKGNDDYEMVLDEQQMGIFLNLILTDSLSIT